MIKKYTLAVLATVLLSMTSAYCDGEILDPIEEQVSDSGSQKSHEIVIEPFSMNRVAELRTYYTNRMRKIRWTVNSIIATLGTGTAALVIRRFYPKRPDGLEQGNLTEKQLSRLEKISQKISDFDMPQPLIDGSLEEKKEQGRQILEAAKYLKSLELQQESLRFERGDKEKSQENKVKDLGVWDTPYMVIKLGAALGVAGLVLTTGQNVLRVLSGTLEDSLSIWWRGYKYWYNAEEQKLRSTLINLRESLQQARKIAQSGYDATAFARTRSRQFGYAMTSHYRADITTMYQVSMSTLEKVVALMYTMAPEEHHRAIYGYVSKQNSLISKLAESLQYDLNENTHGMLTHYSNKTIDLYHELFESIEIFLSTYRAYLHRG